jgi:hypothetical protein
LGRNMTSVGIVGYLQRDDGSEGNGV